MAPFGSSDQTATPSWSAFPMLISLTAALATLRLIFLSRAALELENLALRHEIGVQARGPGNPPSRDHARHFPWNAFGDGGVGGLPMRLLHGDELLAIGAHSQGRLAASHRELCSIEVSGERGVFRWTYVVACYCSRSTASGPGTEIATESG